MIAAQQFIDGDSRFVGVDELTDPGSLPPGVVSEPEGPPLAYFKRGEDAKAAEFIKAWKPT